MIADESAFVPSGLMIADDPHSSRGTDDCRRVCIRPVGTDDCRRVRIRPAGTAPSKPRGETRRVSRALSLPWVQGPHLPASPNGTAPIPGVSLIQFQTVPAAEITLPGKSLTTVGCCARHLCICANDGGIVTLVRAATSWLLALGSWYPGLRQCSLHSP